MTTFPHTHPFFALFQRGFGAKSFERSKLALWHHGIRCHVRPYRYRQIRRWVLEGLLGLWSEIHSGEPLQPAITFNGEPLMRRVTRFSFLEGGGFVFSFFLRPVP